MLHSRTFGAALRAQCSPLAQLLKCKASRASGEARATIALGRPDWCEAGDLQRTARAIRDEHPSVIPLAVDMRKWAARADYADFGKWVLARIARRELNFPQKHLNQMQILSPLQSPIALTAELLRQRDRRLLLVVRNFDQLWAGKNFDTMYSVHSALVAASGCDARERVMTVLIGADGPARKILDGARRQPGYPHAWAFGFDPAKFAVLTVF